METRTAVVAGLLILGLLAIFLGMISWIFSVLTRYGMPSEAYLIVAGLLTVVFALLAAKMFAKE